MYLLSDDSVLMSLIIEDKLDVRKGGYLLVRIKVRCVLVESSCNINCFLKKVKYFQISYTSVHPRRHNVNP